MIQFLCAMVIFGLMAIGGYTAIIRQDPNFLFWNPNRKVEQIYTKESLDSFLRPGGMSLMLTGICGIIMSVMYHKGLHDQSLFLADGALICFTVYLVFRFKTLKKQ